MTDVVAKAVTVMGMDDASYQAGANRVLAANEKMEASGEGVVASTEKITRANQTTAEGFARLEARYDPLIRLEQKRAAAIAQATQYLEEGAVTQDRYAAHIANVNALAASQAQILIERLGPQLNGINSLWNLNRGSLLSLQAAGINAFQALAAGMSPLRVAMMEGGQVLGALAQGTLAAGGAFTALIAAAGPFVPVVAAIAGGLGIAVGLLSQYRDRADDASEATKAYQEAIDKGKKAEDLFAEAIKAGNEVMKTRGQILADTAAKQYEANKQIAQGAVNDLQRQLDDIERQRAELATQRGASASRFGGGLVSPDDVTSSQIQKLDDQIKRLTKDLHDAQVALTNLSSPYISGGQFATDAEAAAAADAEMIKAIQRGHDALDQHLKDQWESEKQAAKDRDAFILQSRRELDLEIKAEDDAASQREQDLAAEVEAEWQRIQQSHADAAKKAAELQQKMADEQRRRDEAAAKFYEQTWNNAIEGIQGAFSTFFDSVFTDGIKSFTDLANQIADIWKKTASQLVSKIILDEVMSSGGSSMGGGTDFLSAFGKIGGATGGGTDWLSQLFGSGTNQFGFRTTGAGPGASANTVTSPGYSWSAAGLSAAANLLPIGAAYASGQSVSGQQLGGAIGGTIGGIAGSYFGPIGGMIGSMIGQVGGSLLGGLFGNSQPPKQKSITDIGVDEGQFAVGGTFVKHDAQARQSRSIGTQAVTALNDILTTLGANVAAKPEGSIADQLLFYGRTPRYMSQVGGVVNQFGNDAAGAQDAMEDFIRRSLQEAVAQGRVSGLSDVAQKAISSAKDFESFQTNVNFAAFYDSLGKIKEPATEASKAIKAIEDQFHDMRKVAEELGVALGPLDEGLIKAKEEYAKGFDKTISDAILAITDPLTLALNNQADLAQQRLREATDAGANLVEVERLNALEREQILKQSNQGLRSFFDELTFGNLSNGNPGSNLEGARAAFEAAAASGDRAGIETYGRAFLGASRGFNASGQGYTDDLARVLSVVGGYITANDNQPVVNAVNDVGALIQASNNLLAQMSQRIAEQAAQIQSLFEQLQARAA